MTPHSVSPDMGLGAIVPSSLPAAISACFRPCGARHAEMAVPFSAVSRQEREVSHGLVCSRSLVQPPAAPVPGQALAGNPLSFPRLAFGIGPAWRARGCAGAASVPGAGLARTAAPFAQQASRVASPSPTRGHGRRPPEVMVALLRVRRATGRHGDE